MTESRLDRGLNAAAGKGRSAAAEVSRDFAVVEDLATLLGVAEYGFTVLFDGYATIQLGVGADARFVSGGTSWRREQLAGSVAAGLAGTPSPDVVSRRPGILLVPQSAIGECRAWVQFPPAETHQRAGDDRRGPFRAGLRDRGRPADRHGPGSQLEEHLNQAMEGHRIIGEAVGILVERHRIRSPEAFELLKAASQHRNIKLREIATRVIQTGQEPDLA